MPSLRTILKMPTGIRRDPWLWAFCFGVVLFLAIPGAVVWSSAQATIIKTALDANANGRLATSAVHLFASDRLASPVAIWFYQLLLLITKNPILLAFLKNLHLAVSLCSAIIYLFRRLETPALPALATLFLLPFCWLLLRPLDDVALALPPAILAFGATIGFCTEATDHPFREGFLALAAAMLSALLSLRPATPLIVLAMAMLLTPPTSQQNHRKVLRMAGGLLLVLAAGHFLWLLRHDSSSNHVSIVRSFLTLVAALPQLASAWKFTVFPIPTLLSDACMPWRWLWLVIEYLTYALALMTLFAGIIGTFRRREERHSNPAVFGGMLAIVALLVHCLLCAFLRQDGLQRDLVLILPALLLLLTRGFHFWKKYLRLRQNCLHAICVLGTALSLCFLAIHLHVFMGDDNPACFGSTLGMQWSIAQQLQPYMHAQPPPKLYNYAHCFQYTPQLLQTLDILASQTKTAFPSPDELPERLYIRQQREGTGLLYIETQY